MFLLLQNFSKRGLILVKLFVRPVTLFTKKQPKTAVWYHVRPKERPKERPSSIPMPLNSHLFL